MAIRSEFPRPNFVRDSFQTLNGEWDFEFDDANNGLPNRFYENHIFKRKIIVPFTYESELSGINDKTYHEIFWYKKNFDLNFSMFDKNILLHFNAVDYYCQIYLNGQFIGEHTGGYTHFYFDITKFVKIRNNELVVRCFDPFDKTINRGKQGWNHDFSRCWYDGSSGIWQSVWLESTEESYIDNFLITTDIDKNSVSFDFKIIGNAKYIKIKIFFKDEFVKEIITSKDENYTQVEIPLKEYDDIDELHYWTPLNPNLYDVEISVLNDSYEILDKVKSYFGFRKIHIDNNNQICLNNERIYQRLVLDQGYYAGGELTAPSIEDIKKDILLAKEMGFNGARMHQKIEDPYFYYYADKLGFLVWAEIPSAYNFNVDEIKNQTALTIDAITQLYNHPSIITWVLFNESWGIRHILTNNEHKNFARSSYYLAKSLDKTRLIDTNDGWENISDDDFISIHDYDGYGDNFSNKYSLEKVLDSQPMWRKLIAYGENITIKPLLLTEYGGISSTDDTNGEFFGYSVLKNNEEVIQRLKHLQANVYKCNFQGFCYTQLTDVKQEKNGLLDIYRNPKYDIKQIKEIIFGDYES